MEMDTHQFGMPEGFPDHSGGRAGTGLRTEDLATLDPVNADRLLPMLVRALASPDEAVAARAEGLLSRHPLFSLKRGAWLPAKKKVSSQKVYFSADQLRETIRALVETTRAAARPVRQRLLESFARFEGLSDLVDGSPLALDDGERQYYEQLLMRRTLCQFKRQITIVLGYGCNKRCSYCFIDALSLQMPRLITLADFKRGLDWARRAGVSRVPVTGGEPTLHPEFPSMMSELRARRLTTCFSTNGCGPRAAFDCLSSDLVETITFHILDDDEYTPEDVERLDGNICSAKEKGIPLIFRYVLHTAATPPWQRYLDLAARHRPAMLSCSPAFPGPHRRDMSRDVRALCQNKSNLLTLIRTAIEWGIRPLIAKPIPLCMFSREELLEVLATTTVTNVCDISQNEYTNNTLVNPDLSLYPCMALPLTGASLATTPSLDDFGALARRTVVPLQQTPMLPECEECQLHQLRLCQAACLSFVAPPPGDGESTV
jgi:hypothetical protein